MTRSVTWLALSLVVGPIAVGVAACVGDEPSFPSDAPDAQAAHDATTDAADTGAPIDARGDTASDADAGGGVISPDASAEAASDASTDALPAADASPCDPTAPFRTIENVAELNGPTDDESARLSPDQRTAYFSQRSGPQPSAGGFNVRMATREDPDASFDAISTLPLGIDPSGPSVSGDGTLLYYASADDGGPPELRVSTRPFDKSNSKQLSNINSDAWDFTPYVRPDNLELYFSSTRTGNEEIYVTERANGDFMGVTSIGAANNVYNTADSGASNERTPVITADGLMLYFASDRSGNFDIYLVRRKTLASAFEGPVVQVTELDTSASEFPDWISPDACTLYFRSDRAGGKGGRDIWRAKR